MKSLSQLNKLTFLIFFLIAFIISPIQAEDQPADIWNNEEDDIKKNTQNEDKKIIIKSPILSDDINKISIKIEENAFENKDQAVVGIFDPEENNFNLNMWSKTDGKDIVDVLNRINKLKLSNLSEELLFQVLFTNAYPPKNNLNSVQFLKIKINWLIQKKRIKDLEILLKRNPEVGKNAKAIKFLVNEYLASTNIKSACDKINFIDQQVQNNYLDKFKIYCLINSNQKVEAQLIFDLLKERGFEDKFFEDKINFLLGITEKTTQKILDDNLLNFYFSYITVEDFKYQPNDKTDKYIWRYLSAINLIQVNDLENEKIISTYEQAAAQNSFENDEIFKIYLKMDFNFNQLVNAQEIYKNLPNYKARALLYQSILLNDNVKKKIDLAILLKQLFLKDKIFNVYAEELSEILRSLNVEEIPDRYVELVNENINTNLMKEIKFDSDVLHRSKVIRHFLENNNKLSRTEKDFKAVYKKIKKNKKYFISIKDIVVLESLAADGISLPDGLKYDTLSSQLTIPKNLEELADQNQIGLVMLKLVEIIGEDSVSDLDPETIYFLNSILNKLNLKKIRNNILSEALPIRI